MKIPLVKNTIDNQDIDKLIEWLQTYPRLTKGELTVTFEEEWSKFIGTKYSVFVNSGSSANLLMLYTLLETGKINKGDTVVVPAVSWATDLAPVVQLGLNPILCDCNLEDLSVDLHHLEEIYKKNNPAAVIIVSILGLVPRMDKILDLCKKYNVIPLEDACESFGSRHKGKNLGSFGLMGTFSTYFGHHLSTIEGGVINTDDREIYNVLKSIRSHGWDRDMDEDHRNSLREAHQVSDFENLYKFYHFGFNLRSTDLSAFIGINQLKKAANMCKVREHNYQLYADKIKNDFWSPEIRKDEYVSNFAYPVISPHREKIVENLQNADIEVRPLVCGNLGNQPVWKQHYGEVSLPNAEKVDKFGMYIPNNHEMGEVEIDIISDIINSSVK
jgi:CDP-6-deoxy-D-xylo-4-hexulose-3-dehydrase